MHKMLIGLVTLAIGASATPAMAQASLTFQITGDTFNEPFTITNNSSPGIRITAFGITLITPYGFDTVDGGFGNDPVPFAPIGGTAATTGYTGPASFADGSNSLAFTFNNFDPGESFRWNIDVDRSSTVLTVTGRDLIGSTGYADFGNGLRGTGTFVGLGSTGSQFQINAFAPTPSVPEPATWAMMIGGFGLVGTAMRRRRATLAALA